MTTTQDLVAKVGVEPTTFRLWDWQATTALLGDKEGLSPNKWFMTCRNLFKPPRIAVLRLSLI